MRRLPESTNRLAHAFLVAARNPKHTLVEAFRSSRRGVFPPLGILSILLLTALTAGVLNWGADRHVWPFYIILAGGILFGFLLWKTPRERYRDRFASLFGWLPVTLGALTYGYWYWYASFLGDTPGSEFFHAAAEVLPVLLLATVVDVRRTRYLESKQLVLPIAAVFLGELAALNILAFGNAGPTDFAAVASSFVTSIVALILAVMADVAPSTRDEDEAGESTANSKQPSVNPKEPSRSIPSGSIPWPPTAGGPVAARADGSPQTGEEIQLSDPEYR